MDAALDMTRQGSRYGESGFPSSPAGSMVNTSSYAGWSAVDSRKRRAPLRVMANGVVGGDRHAHSVAGTMDEAGRGRITAMDGYAVSLDIGGKLLFISHRDQPGRIGAVGTLLGERGINVNSLHVGLDQAGSGVALMLWNVDAEVSDALVQEVAGLKQVQSAQVVLL